MNEQKPEKIDHKSSTLDVHSIFDTIQGEGPFSGESAIFIRLAGCNLQCPLCDTDYTRGRKRLTATDVVEALTGIGSKAKLAVITGGEPFRQDITQLVENLLEFGYKVQLETNGTIFLEGFPYEKVTVVCSPKTPKIHSKLAPHVSAFKYVLSSGYVDYDYIPIKVLGLGYDTSVHKPKEGVKVYVQPCDSKHSVLNKANLETCIGAVKEMGYTLNLQIHKIIGVE